MFVIDCQIWLELFVDAVLVSSYRMIYICLSEFPFLSIYTTQCSNRLVIWRLQRFSKSELCRPQIVFWLTDEFHERIEAYIEDER